MSFNTPILLITYNRPDHVRTALAEIRKQQPSQLYIAQDGPRANQSEDVVKCQEVRDVVSEMIDWPCELHTHFSNTNFGCGRGPVIAMDWFFDNVEFGIILEDDIKPHPLFFSFMEELLIRYKDDNRVGMVCGHNLQRAYYGKASYHFTNAMTGTLGWGTWQRVWKDFKWDINFNALELDNSLKKYYHIPKVLRNRSIKYYSKWLGGTRFDCWDYQWDYYLELHGYLNARANSCLTSHEGNNGYGTHNYNNPNYLMDVKEFLFITISHPHITAIHPLIRARIYLKACRASLRILINKIKRQG